MMTKEEVDLWHLYGHHYTFAKQQLGSFQIGAAGTCVYVQRCITQTIIPLFYSDALLRHNSSMQLHLMDDKHVYLKAIHEIHHMLDQMLLLIAFLELK